MKRIATLFLVLCTSLSLYAQCEGITDTISICGLEYDVHLQTSAGDFSMACPTSDAHIALHQSDTILHITVNTCGEYILEHTYPSVDAPCDLTDTYYLQFSDPSHQQINLKMDLAVSYGEQDTHEGGAADCDNPTEITIAGVDPPVIEWEECYLFEASSALYSAEVLVPNPALECLVDSIDITVTSASGGNNSDCSAFLQDDFYGVAGVDFFDLVNPYFSDAVDDWLGDVLDIPTSDCTFSTVDTSENQIDTIIQENTYYIPVRVGGNWAIIQNGTEELLEDTTNLTLNTDSNYIFIIQPAADYIGPGDITFELLYWDGVDTVQTPTNQDLTVQWIEFWDYDTLTLVDTFYQTNAFACGGLYIHQESYTIPDAPASPFGPFGLYFPAACDCIDLQALWNDGSISCTNETACIEVSGTSSEGPVEAVFDGFGVSNICMSIPGEYPFTITDLTTGCVETGFAYIDYVGSDIDINVNAPPITCENPCPEVNIEVVGGTYESCVVWGPDNFSAETSSFTVCVPGTYEVNAFDENGCETTQTFEVIEDVQPPILDIELQGSGILTCANPCVTAIGFTDVPPNCTWWGSDGQVSQGQSIEICQPGDYQVMVTNDMNGCTATAVVTVGADFTEPVVNILPPDVITCNQSCVELFGETDAPENCYWLDEDGNTLQGTTSTIVCSPGVYTVVVTGNNGCTAVASTMVVTDDTTPDVSIIGNTLICEGAAAVLEATTGYIDYSWNTGEVGPSITVNIGGSYTVTVTDINGCTGENSIEVVEQGLDMSIEGETVICLGQTTTLQCVITDGLNVNYTWFGPTNVVLGTGAEIAVSEPGCYTAVVQTDTGCEAIETICVTVADALDPVIVGNTSICPNTTATLALTESYMTYEWSTSENTSSIAVSEGGLYAVTVSDENGCEGVAEIEVEVLPEPLPIVVGATEFCEGESTTITIVNQNGIPFEGCDWSDGQFGNTIEIFQPGTYCVTAFDENGCIANTCVEVLLLGAPTPVISGDLVVCEGESTMLTTPSGYATYQWSNGSAAITTEVSDAGVVSLTVTDWNGCSGSTDVEVTQSPNPEVSLNAGVLDCCNPETTIETTSSVADGMYNWVGPNGFSSTVQNPVVTAAGMYSVTLTNAEGCTVTESITVESISTPPLVDISASDLLTCSNSSVVLSATVIENANYSWTGPNGFSANEANPTVTESGIYVLQVVDANCCETTVTVEVEENFQTPEVFVPNYTLSCQQTALTPIAQTTNANLEYTWSNIDGYNSTEVSPSITESGLYVLQVMDMTNGCTNTVNFEVDAMTPITADFLTESTCEGTTNGSLELMELAGGQAPYTIEWEDLPGSDFSYENLPAGDYAFHILDSGDCMEDGTVTIEANAPTVTAAQENRAICPSEQTMLDPTTLYELTENTSFEWSTGATSAAIQVEGEGTYTVTMARECERMVHVFEVEMLEEQDNSIFVPNAFSPNEDGVNDTFLPLAGEQLLDYQLMIFDRWGNILFTNKDATVGWNGRLGERTLDEGVFIYHLKASVSDCRGAMVEVNEIGDVTLIR